ncbi:sulfatase [Agrobacterium tumefaciens str. Cherry 2E-2-2]|nr:sulfatase [Agrobacterium tumefaciens str. Cherry 2E-2-2]
MTSFQVDVSKMTHPPLIGPCGSLDDGVFPVSVAAGLLEIWWI